MQKFVPINFSVRNQILYSSNLPLTSVNLDFSAPLESTLISPSPNEAFIYFPNVSKEMRLYFLVNGPIKPD